MPSGVYERKAWMRDNQGRVKASHDLRVEVLVWLKNGWSLSKCAMLAGVTKRTIGRWRDAGRD